jgi:hypothetical protein
MARRAAWLRSERPRRRRQRRRPQRRRSAEKRRRSLAPPYSLRLRKTSTTASNGPAPVDQRTAHCDRFRLAGSGRRQGRRRDRECRLHPSLPQGRAGWTRETDQIRLSPWRHHSPSGLHFGYLADALGAQSVLRAVRRAHPEAQTPRARAPRAAVPEAKPVSERPVNSTGSRFGPCTPGRPRCTLQA